MLTQPVAVRHLENFWTKENFCAGALTMLDAFYVISLSQSAVFETCPPGKIRFEVRKYRTYGWTAHASPPKTNMADQMQVLVSRIGEVCSSSIVVEVGKKGVSHKDKHLGILKDYYRWESIRKKDNLAELRTTEPVSNSASLGFIMLINTCTLRGFQGLWPQMYNN